MARSEAKQRRRAWACAASVAACVARWGEAHAETEPTAFSVKLDYPARPLADCPAEASFFAAVRDRSPRVRLATDAERARTLVVRMVARGGRYEGQLVVREIDGTESRRRVEGETCADVASALAFVAAVAIDPASARPAESAPPAAPEASSPVATPAAASPAARTETADAVASNPGARAPSAWQTSVGAEAVLDVGITPVPLFGARAFVDRSRLPRGPFGARLSIDAATTGDVDVRGGGARFTLAAAAFDLCPLLDTWGIVRVAACARIEGGALFAEGTRVDPPRAETRPWLAGDVLFRVDALLSRSFFIGASAGLRAPFIRDRFFFEPNQAIYRPTPLGFLASMGGGVTFW